jgi:hypothetical protein
MLAAVRSAATSLRVDEGGIHDLSLRAIARPAP